MRQLKKLKICDVSLLVAASVMLVSSVQLEVLSGEGLLWVWMHVAVGAVFLVLIGWHLRLHSPWKRWDSLLWKGKPAPMKWLAAAGLLTLVTAVPATAGWIASPVHSKIGAVHGKFGFLFVALAMWHTARRIRFYKGLR